MVRKILLAALIIISVSGVSELTASASTAEPTIQWFSPESATVASEVTIVGTNLADATSVTFNGTIATAIPDNATRIKAYVPAGATTGYIRVKTPGGNVRSAHIFTVLAPLDNAMSVVSDSDGYCALLTSSGVDCWGDGKYGQLGNGTFYTSSHEGSATPVAVEGVGGTGTLTGVASLVSDNDGYCAVLTSSGVDCWGNGHDGELGNGTFYSHSPYGSATPVAVEGVGGTGRLTGVTSLVGEHKSYCALLTSGGVDCWGYGEYGQLGNGTFYKSSPKGSATPVEVEGVGGTGTLTGVASLVGGLKSYCAVLTSSGVDCWGYGYYGELGNGTFYTRSAKGSATPVEVEGVGGTGTLTGVTSLVGGLRGYCAMLTSSGVDCWGYGYYGQLGNGTFYTSSPGYGSATPVEVESVGATGTLTGVTNLVSASYFGYCALLGSGGVDCWGNGELGQLGNGTFYEDPPGGSATPVEVEGVGGTGTLTEVTSIVGESTGTFCAVLTPGGVDCWGDGPNGGGSGDSATPVEVEGVGGTGTLTGVTNGVSALAAFCAVLTPGGVDCWGYDENGQLGNGGFNSSATPLEVG